MKKKLLVCGSAGFLISNFMRYLLYRSKDFDIVSIDNLLIPEDYKRVYLSRYHRFYVGDVTDKFFIDRIIYIEKPDWIINGIGCLSLNTKESVDRHIIEIINSSIVLSKYNLPTIQLCANNSLYSVLPWLHDKTILSIPNCFGNRQKNTIGLAKIIKKAIDGDKIYVNSDQLPWVYAEDVASLIWYIIENNVYGETLMPPLGYMSIEQMVKIVYNELNLNSNIELKELNTQNIYHYWNGISRTPTKALNIGSWVPDSNNLEESIMKTISWYKTNKWALK